MAQPKVFEILFPGPRRLILAALFADPDRWWSVVELGGRAGVRPGAVRRHLSLLEQAGLVRRRSTERQITFQPDPACPFFAEIHSIVRKLMHGEGGGETILVVEDQPATARITRILLESWGYSVFEAHSAEEALEAFERLRGKIHLLLTDVIMPGMNGTELAAELRRRKPELQVVFMSGYHSHELTDVNSAFLPKPFSPASLSRAVRKQLDGAGRRMNSRSQ